MNDFIGMLLTNTAGYLGNNIYLEAGFFLFIIFGLIYVLNLPKFLSLPMGFIGLLILVEFGAGIGFLTIFVLGIGIGFLIWILSRGG